MVLLLAGCAKDSTGLRSDPALRVAVAVLVLERSRWPLSAEQARRTLPLLEALRELRPWEEEAARALVQRFDALLTPAQREVLRASRDRLRERSEAAARRGSLEPQRMAQVRLRLVERALQVLRARSAEG